jgi:predicted enzyme related to lactoylglutathione lyase
MAKALGIGGIFFKARDPERLASWYDTWLDLEIDPSFGATVFRPSSLPGKSYAVWSPFKETTDYFVPSTRLFMIKLIVDDLSVALEQVTQGGACLAGEPQELDYGIFGWFIDPEGNKIEPREPR